MPVCHRCDQTVSHIYRNAAGLQGCEDCLDDLEWEYEAYLDELEEEWWDEWEERQIEREEAILDELLEEEAESNGVVLVFWDR